MVEYDNDNSWQARPPPLKKKVITCTSSKCEDDLHCFRTNMRKKVSRKSNKTYRNGACVCCGKELVNWDKIDRRKDIQYTFESMQKEYIRQVFWQKEIDDEAKIKAEEKGLAGLRQEAEKIIRRTLSKPSNENHWDGRQTPLSGNVIYYAQHAVAACCRKCAEEWHGIGRNSSLADHEVEYLTKLVNLYLKQRMPWLSEQGKTIVKTKSENSEQKN